MRWLDRWLGVPLCFLLSLAARCVGGWLAPVVASRPRRILCIQLAEMGSIVLAAPAVRWLQDQGAQPYFVSFARNREVLDLAGIVAPARTFLLRTDGAAVFALDVLRFVAWAWRQRLDGVIDFEPCSRFSALLALLSGARLRSGYRHVRAYRGRLHNRPVLYDADRHMSENHLALAAALLQAPLPDPAGAETAWRATLTAGSASELVAAALARRFPELPETVSLVLLNPHAGDLLPQRRWPVERYVQLASRLLERRADVRIGIMGAAAEVEAAGALAARVGSPRCVNLAGDFSISELPALFARCRLLVSNDSGPAHLASLTKTPSVVLFGPETPRLYRPLGAARTLYAGLSCSPCIRPANQRQSRCGDNRCMQAIGVDEVLAVVEEFL